MEQQDVPGSPYIFPALEISHFSEEDWIVLVGNDKNWVVHVPVVAKMLSLLLQGFFSKHT